MALPASLRARLSCANGIVKAIGTTGVGNDVSKAGKAIGYGANFGNNVRRFFADAGNSSSTKPVRGGFTPMQILVGCLGTAGWSYALVSLAEKDLDKKLANLEDKTKVDLRRHVDSKFSEADRKVNSRAANEKISTDCTQEIAKLRREVRDIDWKLNSRAANEGVSAECTREIAKLKQQVRDIDRKVSEWKKNSAECSCSQDIAKLRQDLGNTDRKLNAGLFQTNSRAAVGSDEVAQLRQEVRDSSRRTTRLQETVNRLVADSRNARSDTGAGGLGGLSAKKYKQD